MAAAGQAAPEHARQTTAFGAQDRGVFTLSGPKYHGTVTFDDINNKTHVTMYWTFESADVFAKIRDIVQAGNEGNFDRLSEVVAGQR